MVLTRICSSVRICRFLDTRLCVCRV
jgi:hypothetical protein